MRILPYVACAAALGSVSVGKLEERAGSMGQAAADHRGISLNGISLNGISLNGISLNGISLNGISLNGISLNGISLNGTDFVGATVTDPGHFEGVLSNGEHIELRVDRSQRLGGANRDVTAYAVSFQTAAGWQPLCGVDASSAPILAIPVKGTFNYSAGVPGGGSFTPSDRQITFGCRGAGVAKCVEMGYQPWTSESHANLEAHMVACTRMLRADYCGDGNAWTVNGTPINVFDGAGIQRDTEHWPLEAEWTAEGAACVSPHNALRWSLMSAEAPTCIANIQSSTCGSAEHFLHGTKVMDEYNGG